MHIDTYTFAEFKEMAAAFHGYPAPGLLIGGYMVAAAKQKLSAGTLFEAIVETRKCLPDAVQLLTLCSTGNGWMRVVNLGRYAVSLFDKYTLEGWRCAIDAEKLKTFPEIQAWFLKLTAKKEQNTDQLFQEIEQAGDSILKLSPVSIQPRYLAKQRQGAVGICPVCLEAYPVKDGTLCRGCQGDAPYIDLPGRPPGLTGLPPELVSVPVDRAVGKKALHDMTRIVPGISKGAEFKAGQVIEGGDLCRLQKMGRSSVFVESDVVDASLWVHEDEAVLAFARRMAGEGVFVTPPSEGKINFCASRKGLLRFDENILRGFNLIPDVMCASRQNHIVVETDKPFAATRAIPLYLSRNLFHRALAVLSDRPLFEVAALRSARVGILVTGTEVYTGLVEDRFEPIIRNKVGNLGCTVANAVVVDDNAGRIAENIGVMREMGVDLLITTAGLSVDPDDQTRQGLIQAGMTDFLYGAPILPGAMTLVGKIRNMDVIGVPACALFHKITSLDLLLPRILAGQAISRMDLAKMADGAFCLNCNLCTFPKCPFGK